MAATLMPSNRRAVAEASDAVSKLSWIYLISGVIWILFGAVVLSLELDYVGRYTVALLVGGFLMGWGVFQFVGAVLHQRSHWVFHAVGGVLAIGAGVVAVSWPDVTLFTLTLIIGFSLIVWGILDIASAFAVYGYRHWWLYLIRGVAAATLGVIALGHRDATLFFLLTVLGVGAIIWGVGDLVLAYMFHGVKAAFGTAAGGGRPAPARSKKARARKPAARKSTTRKPARRPVARTR